MSTDRMLSISTDRTLSMQGVAGGAGLGTDYVPLCQRGRHFRWQARRGARLPYHLGTSP